MEDPPEDPPEDPLLECLVVVLVDIVKQPEILRIFRSYAGSKIMLLKRETCIYNLNPNFYKFRKFLLGVPVKSSFDAKSSPLRIRKRNISKCLSVCSLFRNLRDNGVYIGFLKRPIRCVAFGAQDKVWRTASACLVWRRQ